VRAEPHRRTPASFRFDVDAVSRRREGDPLALAKSGFTLTDQGCSLPYGPAARKPTPYGTGSPGRASSSGDRIILNRMPDWDQRSRTQR
jgi:hypothetical protein